MSDAATCTLPAMPMRVVAREAVYSTVPCRACGRVVMAIPGAPHVTVTVVRADAFRSGRGRVVSCPRCRTLNEVVERATEPA